MFKVRILICAFIAFFVLTGCSAKHDPLPNRLEYNSNISFKSVQGIEKLDSSEGIDVRDDGIYIKNIGRPILTLIDEVSYKTRVNYSIVGALPDARPLLAEKLTEDNMGDISKLAKQRFSGAEEFFRWLVGFMNSKGNSKYSMEKSSDGFKIVQTDATDKNTSFKKLFLFNLTTSDAKKYIEELFKDSSSKFNMITIPSQNALVIRGNDAELDKIGNIFFSFDADSPQVLIESKVFEFDDTLNNKIGLAFEYSKTNGDFSYGLTTIFGEGLTSAVGNILASQDKTEIKQKILATLALEKRDGGVKILAEPRLMLKPGSLSSIQLNSVKYINVSGVQSADLKDIKTGITFEVTPTILSQKSILLDIRLKQSEFLPNYETGIVQSTNENDIKTSIVVNDGELISLGGIYLDKSQNFSYGIPYLKDAPIVGWLFGTKSTTTNRTAIEFMIRPTIKNIKSKLEEHQQKMKSFTKEVSDDNKTN